MRGELMSQKRNILLTVITISVIALITAVIVGILLSYQNSRKNANSYLTANTIVSRVIKKMDYQNLTKISDENISKYYIIPEGTVTDSAMYISNRTDSGIEFACFRLADENSSLKLSDAISEHISSKNTENKEGSGQLAKVKTDTVYPYVFVAVASDSEAAANAFKEVVNEK